MTGASDRYQKFVRLMMLTTSDKDHEALAALRKANAFLADAGFDWEALLASRKEPPTETIETPPEPAEWPAYDSAADMIDWLMGNPGMPSFVYDFAASLSEFLDRTGRLTDKQFDALRRTFRKNNPTGEF
jgi:hypothetical protein